MTKKAKPAIKSKQPPRGEGNNRNSLQILFFALLILGSALFFIPSLLERYVSSRFTLASGVLLWGGMLFYLRSKVNPKAIFHILDALFLGFYLINIAGILQAFNFGEAIFTAQKISISFWAYFLIRHLLAQSANIRSSILNIIAVLTGILQLLLVGQILYYAGEKGLNNDALYAVSGAMGNKSLASEFLFLLLPFNVMNYYEYRRKSSSKLILALLLVSVGLIVILQVRTVYVALVLFLTVFGISQIPALLNYSMRQWAKLGISVIAGLAILIAVLKLTGAWTTFSERVNPVNYLASTSAEERRFVWYKTRLLIDDHWWRGVGTGNWKVVFPDKGLSGAYRMQEQNIVFTRTHNDYLEIWAELGIIGLLSYLAIFIVATITCLQLLRKDDASLKREALLLLLGIIGYGIICFFDFPKERIEHQVILSLTLAWVAWRGHDFLFKWGIPLSSGLQSATGLIFSGIMLFNLVLGYYRMKGDYYAYKIAVYQNNYPKLVESAQAGKSAFYTLDPSVIPLPWFEGLAYSKSQQMEKARTAFKEAYDLNPYCFQVISNYATALATSKDYKAAIPLYLRCLEINPKFEDGIFNLSFCYVSMKQYDKALETIRQVKKDTARRDTFIQQIEQLKLTQTE
jgi:O-antigen ligase